MTTIENQYLVGNFAPVKDELTVTDLPVEGAIPPEINGRYLRNGPNPIAPDPAEPLRAERTNAVGILIPPDRSTRCA